MLLTTILTSHFERIYFCYIEIVEVFSKINLTKQQLDRKTRNNIIFEER